MRGDDLSDYIAMIGRRLSGLLSCILALTFSGSGSRACDAMAHKTATQAPAHSAAGSHDHHSPVPSDPHRHSDNRTPLDHCAGATSCAGVVLTADVVVDAIDVSHSDRVAQSALIAPVSQSPDLEPPPPKA